MERKRIFAWALLVGFVLLLINILFVGYYRAESGFIYIALVLVFLVMKVTNRKKSN